MLLVLDDLGLNTVCVAGAAFHVIVRLKTERIRFAMTIEKTGELLLRLGDAQNTVGNISLGRAVDGQLATFTLKQGRTGKLDAAQFGLCRVERGIKKLDGDLRILCRHLLVEFNCFAHAAIVKKHHMHWFVDRPEHVHRLGRK